MVHRRQALGWLAAAVGIVMVALLAGVPVRSAAVAAAPSTAGEQAPGTGEPAPGTGEPAPGTGEPAPEQQPLFPDLVPLRAGDLSVQTVGTVRKLRFASSLANIGLGPLEVRPNRNLPCPRGQHNSTQIVFGDANGNGRYNRWTDTGFTRHRAGCMVYHPYHDHWHFKASARYTLLDPRAAEEPVVVSARRKVSFCLRDTNRVPEWYGTWNYPEAYGACSRRSPQGISVGWMDVYQSYLAGQSLQLPKRLEDGVYCLRTVVDPLDQLAEADNENNTSIKALAIKGVRVLPRDQRFCR
jgi:hypothetical protein